MKTDDTFGAESELDFGLDMGDTVKFQKGKIGKQLKIAPGPKDLEKIAPDPAEKKDIDMTITHEDREKVKKDRQKRKAGRPQKDKK